MSKIIIADVLYTVTDETYYVLNGEHENAAKYQAATIDAVYENIVADGWTRCGKLIKATILWQICFQTQIMTTLLFGKSKTYYI